MSEPDKKPTTGYAVCCGLDVGKADHHACGLDPTGTRLHDRALPNDEAALVQVFTRLAEHGPVLAIVDQPASIGALPIAVARGLGIEVAYLPGLAMRRIADLHPGEGKTDARDAYIIAEAARTMPHTLRRVGTDDETLAELGVLAGYDDDLTAQSTRLTNRLRDALLHVHPALERLVGPRLDRGGVVDLLAVAPTPQALRDLGADGIATIMRPRSPRLAKTLPTQILTALATQTVVVAGTAAFGRVIVGVAAAFPTAGHLAAYAGLAPVTRRSGSSIKGETRSQRGNHALKSALFLSAFASLADPDSRAYYDRKRAQGKRHNAALTCLARRRVDVIFAMLRDRKPYQPPTPAEPDSSPAAA